MDSKEFRKYGYELIDWIAGYIDNIETLKVSPNVEPGDIKSMVSSTPPSNSVSFKTILRDYESLVGKGLLHWQHPCFFGYFPANSSFPSILGELACAGLGVQAMSWATSPLATELEEKMMIWLREAMGIPKSFHGVIQEGASIGTLCSLLTAREKKTDFRGNKEGVMGNNFTIYASEQAHSSIEKAVSIIGLGYERLRYISTDNNFSMIPELLDEQIKKDTRNNFIPLAVIATIGTTSSGAIDPIFNIGNICKKHNIWLHVDAAYGGSITILPEKKHLIQSLHLADTYVFNPHKWLFINLDCSAYFAKDKISLQKTLSANPEYLKTDYDSEATNYRDWGISLGRKFRALKLWFTIRRYGINEIQQKIKFHLELTDIFVKELENISNITIIRPIHFGLVCFRWENKRFSIEKLNTTNKHLLDCINKSGKVFISHTKLGNLYTLRVCISGTYTKEKHVHTLVNVIKSTIHSCI